MVCGDATRRVPETADWSDRTRVRVEISRSQNFNVEMLKFTLKRSLSRLTFQGTRFNVETPPPPNASESGAALGLADSRTVSGSDADRQFVLLENIPIELDGDNDAA